MSEREGAIDRLYRRRPRSRFLRWSLGLLAAILLGSWWLGEFHLDALLSARRLANLSRFLGELRPFPLQDEDFDLAVAFGWARGVMADRGWSAMVTTLAISVAAIVMAGLFGALLSLPAARNFSSPQPFLPSPRPPRWRARLAWWLVVASTRSFLIFARAIPEYVWAFLLLVLFGPTAWPAVLALALHNAGILGKLTAEITENLEPRPLSALRGLGASRSQIALAGLVPSVLNRFLLFFFYRWETCVREATVLGLLGIVSLGYWIQDARARNHYDEMFFLVLLGSVLVLVGDAISSLARELLRRSS